MLRRDTWSGVQPVALELRLGQVKLPLEPLKNID